jgi:uncharacterized protein YbjT (DUF2867 family)
MSEPKRTALLAGATGLVGGHLLKLLLASPRYDKIVVVTRRQVMIEHPKLHQIVGGLADVEQAVAAERVHVDDAFCALGTTIKVAGSQAEFRKVDFEYVVRFASAARSAGATRFMLVSAVGASPRSRIFYSRVKGETEDAVAALAFERLHIFRPGVLLGTRGETRPGESVMMVLSPVLNPLLRRRASIYKSIRAEMVAAAMLSAADAPAKGRQVHNHDEMQALVRCG